MTRREMIAAALALSAPVVHFLSFHSDLGDPFRTSAGHGLLLITLPLGLVSVWLLERRTLPQGQRPSPVWARLLLGGAAGLLLASALVVLNALGVAGVRQIPATSLGTVVMPGSTMGPAEVRLEDGGVVRFQHAFCGVRNSKVHVLIGRGLLGLDRIVGCEVPFSPPEGAAPKKPIPIAPPPLPAFP